MVVVLYELAGIAGINYLGVSAFYMCMSVVESFKLCTMATILAMVQSLYLPYIWACKIEVRFLFSPGSITRLE